MKQLVGRGLFSQPSVATITMGRSLLLASSGAVRRLHNETILARIKKWAAKWGLSISSV
jgi:hypothetical protein